jgi:hypothetical protein
MYTQCLKKDDVIRIMKENNVYAPPRKRRLESEKEYQKKVKMYCHRVDMLAEKLELISEAYEYNFQNIIDAEKESREHLKLVIIGELLDSESIKIREKLRIRAREAK